MEPGAFPSPDPDRQVWIKEETMKSSPLVYQILIPVMSITAGFFIGAMVLRPRLLGKTTAQILPLALAGAIAAGIGAALVRLILLTR